MRIESTLLIAGAMVAMLCVTAPLARGADSKECKASRKCRGAIVSSASKATSSALKGLDKCHAQRDTGKFQGDCNARDLSGALSKGAGKIGKKCSATDPVRCLFDGCDPVAWISQSLGAAIRETGETVQGSPDLAGDKARIKCHSAIGKARSAIAKALLKQTIGTKRVNDAAGNCGFEPLQQTPLTAPSSVAAGQRAKISRACGGLTGEDVGSCSPLPECVIASAEAFASQLVVQFYSTAPICGDGIVSPPNEQCDDSNEVDDDACSNSCRSAVCGDNIQQSSEECDDNSIDTDTCAQCKAARCGDGFLWTDDLPAGQDAEQCDDGNDVADDGCTSCKIDAVACDPAVGYRVTVAIQYDQTVSDMNSITVNLGYPVGVSIPGKEQEPSVQERISILQPPGEFLALGNDKDTDTNGVDDTLTVGYADLADDLGIPDDGIPPGDHFEVRYECAEGAKFSGDDFTCVVGVATTLAGTSVDDAKCSVRVSAP